MCKFFISGKKDKKEEVYVSIICFCCMSFLRDIINSIAPKSRASPIKFVFFSSGLLVASTGIELGALWFIRMVLTCFNLSILALCLIVVIKHVHCILYLHKCVASAGKRFPCCTYSFTAYSFLCSIATV